MSARVDPIAEQLEVFDRTSRWHFEEACRLVALAEAEGRKGLRGLPGRARACQALEEIRLRNGQFSREYMRWLEGEGILEAVRELMKQRTE